MRPALAISLYLAGKKVVLVGTGQLADERAARLADAGANVVRVTASDVDATCLEHASALFALTGDPASDHRLCTQARKSGVLAYAHDQPDTSDFAMPALARRGPLSFAISTDGAAPALARRLREELERLLAAAAEPLDALLLQLIETRRRKSTTRRSLTDIARRLRLSGRIEVEPL